MADVTALNRKGRRRTRRAFASCHRGAKFAKSASGGDWVLCLHNVTNTRVTVDIATGEAAAASTWIEMLSERPYSVGPNGTIRVSLRPYEVNWLAAQGPRPMQMVVVK